MKHSQMQIEDCFWSPVISKMCNEIIPYQYEVLNDEIEGIPSSHAIENFRIASGQKNGKYVGMLFQDSDVAKWIEAAAYSLKVNDDPEIRKKIEDVIDLIEQTQQEDGYLDTYYICEKPDQRLKNIAHGHEMYCAGHLLEAAVGYAEVTGEERFLHIMERYIKWFMDRIGPDENQLHIYPGHPELELALYKLYQYTGNDQYLEFMKYILMERGKQPSFLLEDSGYGEQYHDKWFALEYHQAHKPVLEQTEAVGHAVRAMYLYSGMADLAKASGDEALFNALKVLWTDVTTKKMYITGAIGSDEHGEGFSIAYDLPNDRAYAETCASIGLMFFANAMLKNELIGEYADVMETAFYNTVLGGMQLDGKRFFYVNPLEVVPGISGVSPTHRHDLPVRPKWYACACCPPNVARLITSFGCYAYGENSDMSFCHLYADGEVKFENGMELICRTDYPYDMTVNYSVVKGGRLAVRIPGWSDTFTLVQNGKKLDIKQINGYVILAVKDGDEVQLTLSDTPHFVYPSVKIPAVSGMAAIRRGPLVYCFEDADNGNVLSLALKRGGKITVCEPDTDNPDKITRLKVEAVRFEDNNKPYSFDEPKTTDTLAVAVPYYTWGNRGENAMRVFMPLY